MISSLSFLANTIQADYMPGQGFAQSAGTFVENVRAARSSGKRAPFAETIRRSGSAIVTDGGNRMGAITAPEWR
jgi:hypothetical protein